MEDNIEVKKYEQTTLRKTNPIKDNNVNDSSSNITIKCKYKKLWIILGIFVPIIIGGIIAICILIYKAKNNRKISNSDEITDETTSEDNNENDPFSVITPIYEKGNKKLESEFEFKTKVGDLRRIYINQKYQEDRIYEGQKITRIKERITNYDIFILSESKPQKEFENFYNVMYTCAISTVNECYSSNNEECIPETLMDLTGSEIHNTRGLEEVEDLKDIPVPICLFNLTNNDVITSIKCPDSLSGDKIKSMVLDLYFFRPPGIKRPDKKAINVTITKELKGENIFIRETNGGICDIENSFNSFCTTDMNTTTDKEGNILKYEEEAYMNIETDELNSYTKNKVTKLVDKTNETVLDYQKYNSTLNQLLPQIQPYFKYDELFSKNDFEEILVITKEGTKGLKKLRNQRNERKLYDEEDEDDEKPKASIENNLMNFDGNSGIKVELNLINNAGIGNEYMEANSKLKIENKKKELSSSKKSSLSVNEIINSLVSLSQAGNNLATQLYQNTNISLVNITEDINNAITYLNSLVKYKDISDIFDATLSLDSINKLPYVIVQESSNLRNKLEQLLNSIENGGIKKNIKILFNNIYQYTEESHNIINQLFENLSELGKSLSSSKSKLTEISTYYLNTTCNSYTSTIEEAEKILINYYKDEYNLIKPKVDQVLKVFEDTIVQSLQKQSSIINSLYEKIENNNYTIELANEDELKTVINNLYYLKNYLIELIDKVKTKVIKEMDIKDNGYLMTNYDINSNNERSVDVIANAKEIAKRLDNDEYIDTKFDEVMNHFRENFTNIQKFMDKEKEEKFPLSENVLKDGHFSSEVQNNMQNDINQIGVDILNSIRNENDFYLKEKNRIIKEFIENDQEYLNTLTFEIDSLFTERKVEEIANLYKIAFQSCLNKTSNELNNNNNSAFYYFTDLANIILDDNRIIELLKHYKTDSATLLKYNPWSRLRKYEFSDSISEKYKTTGYLNKYQTFIESFARSRDFIKNQIYGELLSEYKNIMFKLRETLQNFKNNKLTSKYTDTSEFIFIDNHINAINNLYNRLNNKISDNIFNENYIKIYDEFNKNSDQKLNNIDNFIAQKHNIINTKSTSEDINYDFCLTYKRKISYTCVNGVVSTHTHSDDYCFPVSNSYHTNLIRHSIYTDNNYLFFKNKFNEFYNSINERVNKYTFKITKLKASLLKAEEDAINKKYTLNYLSPIEENISSLLSQKYGDELIKSSYNYYENNIKDLMEPLLTSISNKWKESYDILIQEINDNKDNFKNSITEFSYMATIYSVIIKNNATNNYFNSIDIHQKNEFNYTMKYYYNILLKLVKSTQQYIINKIPNNRIGYNNLLDKRKNEVNNIFNNLINNIENSEKNALNLTYQSNVLKVPKTNFFKINDVLSNNKLETDLYLKEKIDEINKIRFSKAHDEFSLTSRFYLENQQSKLQVDDLYDQINRKVFVFLNLEKFKEILKDNWIFDQDQFIMELNNTLYKSNLEIDKEFLTEKEKYHKILEDYITESFTKETLINRINDLYKNEITDLSSNQIKEIRTNLEEIINKIKLYINDESAKIQINSNSYNNNFTKINNRISSYKTQIFRRLNETIFNILEVFYQKLNSNFHNQYVLEHLNECILVSKMYTETYSEFNLLNSSYRIGNIIDNIIDNIVVELKNISKNQIDYIYKERYNEIKNKVGLNDLEKIINDQINQEFNSKLIPALEKVATTQPGVTGYFEYDFNDTIIETVNSLIETNMNKISNIMNTLKGSNYDVNINLWEKDCTAIDMKVENINDLFNRFIYNELNNQEDEINDFLQKIIKDNFDNLINNIIPSFGNDFFERIIKYNQNFKISSLYNSLTYSLMQTASYYLFLHSPESFSALTKDLKLKLFTFNNLDSVVQEKNNEVLKMLEDEVNEFINNSKDYLIQKYRSYLTTDLSIELSFNDIIYSKIKTNLNAVQLEIETDYINLLNKYFKKELIESYSKIMNEKTEQMVNTIKDERESLKSKIDDYFTLEPDSVLNDINLKLNNTLGSIEAYKKHFNSFQISDDLIQFLDKYGDNSVKPNFENFINIVNDATKHKINSTVEKNSIDYINYFNLEEFNEQSNNVHTNFKDQYFTNINSAINTYGIEEYPENLENQILFVNENKRRRLGRMLTDEEIRERVADKAIDDTFVKLLNSSNNAKTFINSLKIFDEFNSQIEKNINNLNIKYKSSMNLIKKNNYEEEIHNFLIQKLTDLKNMTLNYYNNISETFNGLKNYLNNSINEIDNNIKKCANITYSIFAEKYINISKNVESINFDDEKNITDITDIVSAPNQGNDINVEYKTTNMLKRAKFYFDLIFDGIELKKPKVKINVINKSKPDKLYMKLIEPQNTCGQIIEEVEAEFREINYSLNINFYTNSTELYANTFVDFDSYYISKELYEIEEKTIIKCVGDQGNQYCSQKTICDENNPKPLSNRASNLIPRKLINENTTIHLN